MDNTGQTDANSQLDRLYPVINDLGEPATLKTDYQLPAEVSLCGESLPLDRPSVQERLEAEFQLVVHHPAQVELWRRRAKRYFPLIASTLQKFSLPQDLKFLAVAESDLRPNVVSPMGATGLWQFMPATARTFGLKVNKTEDQRLLPDLLLTIGLKYLTNLHNRFKSWPLAFAAYNSGEARVARAISSQNTRDYFELDLPRETERYVYRIIAIKLVLEGHEAYGFNSEAPPNLYQPSLYKEENVTFTSPVTWKELAARRGHDYKTLKLLNPHLASQTTLSGGPFLFRTPI
ncbi:MAG: lytic transglycosylase domain-containing protein [Deltaproteobacteria bacterium]|nr:lytic transglycosylase domain-containing protein [Deltaproteobacteria bacterium]